MPEYRERRGSSRELSLAGLNSISMRGSRFEKTLCRRGESVETGIRRVFH
jgi:hypothetical protein